MIYQDSLSRLIPYGNHKPILGKDSYLAAGAFIIGDFLCGDDCSFWFNSTVRADCNTIRMGHRVNVQDNSVIHVTNGTGPTVIGDEVTIGHGVVLHACHIDDRVLVGMNATVLDGVYVGKQSFIAAGSLLTPRSQFPERSMIMGSPAKVKRTLTDAEINDLDIAWKRYIAYKAQYIADLKKAP